MQQHVFMPTHTGQGGCQAREHAEHAQGRQPDEQRPQQLRRRVLQRHQQPEHRDLRVPSLSYRLDLLVQPACVAGQLEHVT
jgi:hypothetical protein